MTIDRALFVSAGAVLLISLAAVPPASAEDVQSTFARVLLGRGNIIPAGPPLSPPVRVDAGDSCIVDIVLPYHITGALSGTAEINYRIDVKGPCAEAAPGVFDESWIARGVFTGWPGDASFVYTADVKAGGRMRGEIILGQGLSGRLWVSGSLADAELDYRGFVE